MPDIIQTVTLPNNTIVPIRPSALSDGTHTASLPSIYSDVSLKSEIFKHSYNGYNTSSTGPNGSFNPALTVDKNMYGSSNDYAGTTFYFGVIKANDYNQTCSVTFEVEVWCPYYPSRYYTITKSHFDIVANTFLTYANWNSIRSTSYRPIYYTVVYNATEAGSTTYGHALGFSLYGSPNYSSSTYYRYAKIRVLDIQGGTFEPYIDSAGTPVLLKYASIPGTGSTNYNTIRVFNATDQGLQESGDSNSGQYYLNYYTCVYAKSALAANNIAVNNDDGTGYFDVKTGAVFDIRRPVFVMSGDVSASSWDGNARAYLYHYVRTIQGMGTGVTAARGDCIYIKGTLSGTKFTPISTTPIVTTSAGITESDDGYCYYYIGTAYNASSYTFDSTARAIFAYKNGKWVQVSGYALEGGSGLVEGDSAINTVVARIANGTIQTEKLAVSTGSTTKATIQYNSTDECVEFIFS